MKTIKIYQVDAFTGRLFGGNPAAVCILDKWPDASLMQSIAAENNLAETAFIVQEGDHYLIRWFTPTVEVDLCGHATLASGFVVLNNLDFTGDEVLFISPRSGKLRVRRAGDILFLDFPTDVMHMVSHDPGLVKGIIRGIGVEPVEIYRGKTDFMAVLPTEAAVREVRPVYDAIATLDARGLIVTAPGDTVDFVSRFFGPQSGVNEDPVTGSAHTTLIPYWSARLGKTEMEAQQVSTRTGALKCRFAGERVFIGGAAQLYLAGEIYV